MKFTIEIQCDNAAFDGNNIGYETATILRDAAKKLETLDGSVISFSLFDSNGNKVGKAEYKD